MRLSPIILSAATSTGATSTWFSNDYQRAQAHQQHQPSSQHNSTQNDSRADFQRMAFPKYRAELSTEFFLVPGVADKNEVASVASVVSVPAPNRTISIYQRGPGYPGHPGRPVSPVIPVYPDEPNVGLLALPLFRQQPWALPLAALSAAAMLLMAAFEVFVLFKARAAAPSRRHLFLGQALLLGLFLLAGLSAAASLTANPLSCAAFRLVGLPAALVFAALLVKCVFLLSLNSGVYLPAPYQALVLVFAVLVQVAIVGQWFFGKPPAVIQIQNVDRNTPAFSCCKTPLGQTVASLGYPGMLLLAVTCLAVRARGVRDNHREAAFIGLAVSISLPVWVSSCIGSMAASEKDREAWLAYGLLITAILVFLTMFLPKGRQFIALGRERAINDPIQAIGDHDDRFSSLPGSGYSPSFFHFKPGETSIKSKIHCHNADIHGPVETYVLPPTMYLRSDDIGNLHTTVSSNPNVFFKRAHAGMMY